MTSQVNLSVACDAVAASGPTGTVTSEPRLVAAALNFDPGTFITEHSARVRLSINTTFRRRTDTPNRQRRSLPSASLTPLSLVAPAGERLAEAVPPSVHTAHTGTHIDAQAPEDLHCIVHTKTARGRSRSRHEHGPITKFIMIFTSQTRTAQQQSTEDSK
ncbi:uncharacterized protein LAESUDRAFT_720653 [Laetiporus sulphureus 93-53]|uniref:Uncharacterized protein n=1 Tax=Laetiporus sulphureus 93-53 TaxID=1314785 RepID=A0A165H9E6_9APHY|nr:uncharacterized protein LAESUDRAFT_720653 [Laetiporus sulphureus 93-53]KZT11425.1 hypothetical protein LAESUDRAFT_720653 [Laetiporus sulphureus 93-53]